jgi:mono/diheme cytochrome c family protein
LRASRAALVAACLVLPGCRQDMHDQPRFRPFRPSTFFADRRSARPLAPGTVAQGDLRDDEHLYTGKINGQLAPSFPFPVTRQVLERGRERFDIFCSPCHGRSGDGRGMIVQRGFKQPPSYHEQRLREAPPGHFFDVITNGYGAMTNFDYRVPVRDRWAIVAYIRALQFSQNATLADLSPDERKRLP